MTTPPPARIQPRMKLVRCKLSSSLVAVVEESERAWRFHPRGLRGDAVLEPCEERGFRKQRMVPTSWKPQWR